MAKYQKHCQGVSSKIVHTGPLSGTRGQFFQREPAGFWTHKAINFSRTSDYGSHERLSGKTSERKSLPLKSRHAMWRSSESEECRETTKGVLGIIASGGRGGVERSDSGYSRLKRPSSISFLGKKKHSAKPQWARKRQRSPRRNPQSAAPPPPKPPPPTPGWHALSCIALVLPLARPPQCGLASDGRLQAS